MTAIHHDSPHDDATRRARLYAGDLYLYSPTATTLAFAAFARELIGAAFPGRDPERAQYELPVAEFAAILAGLKPRFIHHPESKRFIRAILVERGCDPDRTYFDVPRLRSSTSDGYLTTGIAYAFHPHRDTWYSAPTCQLNWWLPVFPVEAGNGMAFHPQYFATPVPNTSAGYDYQRWNATSRFNAAQHVGKDTREQPKPTVPVAPEPDLRLVPPVGGLIVFSAAQLHSSCENRSGRTRYSIDFRTVDGDDAAAARGAPNLDAWCTGTAMPDFLRVTDLAGVPADVVALHLPGHPDRPRA